MNELIAITLPDQHEVEYARLAVLEMNFVLDLGDIVTAKVDENGTVTLHQSVQMVGVGAVERGFLGALVGLLFHSPRFGSVIGSTIRAIEEVDGWLADIGLDEHYMKNLASLFKPGVAVVFLQVHGPLSKRGLERLKEVGGIVLRTALDEAAEHILKEALEDLSRPIDPEYAVDIERTDEDRIWCHDRSSVAVLRA